MITCKVYNGQHCIFDAEIKTYKVDLVGMLTVMKPTADARLEFGPACAWVVEVTGPDLLS